MTETLVRFLAHNSSKEWKKNQAPSIMIKNIFIIFLIPSKNEKTHHKISYYPFVKLTLWRKRL